jgi:dihydrolipoamide dehydrogenase
MHDIIVIGGGPAGVTAALRARELGASVALVERDRLGGTCTNDGCVPTRVLARAARLAREAHQFADYGLMSERPDLDFAETLKRAQQVVYTIHEKKQLIKALEDAGVELYFGAGEARFIDENTIDARRLGFPGAEHTLTHSDIWSLKKLPGKIIIIGAAATGCQLASIFEAFGAQVWLLDVNDRILKSEDSSIATAIHQAFVNRGISIITSIAGVERIERRSGATSLVYTKDGAVQTLDADAVVLAVGWPGNIERLNLEAAGVAVERGFIPVDDFMRTSVEHIFAAGDITGRMGLVQSAGYDARVATENAVLGTGQPYQHRIVPHGGFTDPEYGSVGLTEDQARASHDVVVAEVPYATLDRAVIDGRTDGSCKLIASRDTHRILGAHVAGEQALEVIHLVAAGMAADMWVEQLAELEIAYPTYTAIVGLAARSIIRDLGVVPLAPEWRALGKGALTEWERRDI